MSLWKSKDEFPGSISLPYGIKTSHTWHEIGQILRVINDLDIQTFVELGAHVGGLASILLPVNRYRDFVYFGVEHKEEIIHPTIRDRIYIADIFNIETVETIKRVKMNRKTFIYCDNGDKVKEMWYYLSTLNSGDVIACHDYYDGQDVYGLKNFGLDDSCGCKPEVWKDDLLPFSGVEFEPLPAYLLEGTRIMGFTKI